MLVSSHLQSRSTIKEDGSQFGVHSRFTDKSKASDGVLRIAYCVKKRTTAHDTRPPWAFSVVQNVSTKLPPKINSPHFYQINTVPIQFVGRITQGVINAFGFADRDDITD